MPNYLRNFIKISSAVLEKFGDKDSDTGILCNKCIILIVAFAFVFNRHLKDRNFHGMHF